MTTLQFDRFEAELPPHVPRPAGAPTALEGIRVVDFTHFIAGPFATTIMAEMGADVIKVETPGRGDEFRHYPPVHPEMPAQGAPHMWTNRNKRSVALNLKTPEGLAVVRELIAGADVVVENFSTGVMARFGLDYESCRKINPKLVYCSVSAYGREGEFADRLGFDPIAQAESGFISMNGYGDRQGVRTLSPVVDISTAMMACNAILGALIARGRTGEGQAIEVALFDNAVLMTGYASMQHLFSGVDPQRHGNTSPDTCPSGVFQSKDKPFYINCGNDKIFHRLVEQVLERPDLADDPVLSDRNGRISRRDELFKLLEEAFAQQPWSHWQPRMRAASIPCGEVRTVGEALRSKEARARGLLTRIPHPVVGWMPNIAMPFRFSGTPVVDPVAAPSVGQHTDEVLGEVLGYDATRLAALRATGALSATPPRKAHMPAEPAAA
ncbi:Succinyl-CoA:(R)-benzylsuccinate CoA-transferase subunit BbsF [Variovorax sp. PBL-H6]|uniref:CaiB/BaiF CoA transferase family protein n=1 Tax=Variovorax sp. PBL-H6 TaxID=434009 RepID=UPI00131961D1|nr:CoA transferase [Variovorax sp. PBL-H6]VTU32055.1 Succinyl-CoA:(R)-benzylsuccinate CoA-transferase subunit BbsF [Variovorax sp. PBL-H6]